MAEQFRSILQDNRIEVTFGEEVLVMKGGLQPYLLSTSDGTMIVQAQLPEPPNKTKKMVYHALIGTALSRDGGNEWQPYVRQPGYDDINMEGGAVQLQDGTIVALDTFVLPSLKSGEGVGELWTSSNDWTSLEGPIEAIFAMPDVDYDSGTNDMGESHNAGRLHRSIVELPDGDLLTTMYCRFKEDLTPSSYLSSLLKARTILFRSSDKGRSWTYVASVTKDTDAGTEGYVEPVLVYLTQGKYKGRLICHIRTGRELVQTFSDNEGLTWNEPVPLTFGEIDIYKTEDWEEQFRNAPAFDTGEPSNMTSLIGMYADPELIELRNGVLVAAFGVRIPEKACWFDPSHPWNGNYLAFSFDQGDSWSCCIQVTSGLNTTHYMGVRELQPNMLYIVYDTGHFWEKSGRSIMGRKALLHFNL